MISVYRSIRPAALAVVASLAGMVLARADDLPALDSATYCRNFAALANNSEPVRAMCMSTEESTRAKIARVWSSTPADMRTDCNKFTAFAGGTYAVLGACLSGKVGTAWLDGQLKLSR